ncbi:hypothetical protein [Paenibacillus abyssi]|uniref:Phosphoadenosine phosphosulphate reductase domain-containing protein n=1 Tax=Paenibacillus abyssi TaxID=1340531 RepID=A0A917G250_9BACL|nr:hypothetical protein [Paenibacillus abyssi]GGG18369.1 hypothetical protein GCM10010916_39000 [Paenibacillus abyssi]
MTQLQFDLLGEIINTETSDTEKVLEAPVVNPSVKHVVCYSGGETSGIVAYEVARHYGPENMILINHDINPWVEHWDIKRYKTELAESIGVPITYANMPGWDEKDQFDVSVEAKAFKAGVHPLCTNRLKTAPFHKWLETTYPLDPETGRNDEIIIYYGFEAGETERIERRRRILQAKGYQSAYPLAEWSNTISSTREFGVNPPETYDIWKHANCTGCLRAGRQHWYVVYCRRRDVWEKAKAAEAIIGYSILKDTYLKDLEPRFEAMRIAGIQADEKTKAATFWAAAKRILGYRPKEDEVSCELLV